MISDVFFFKQTFSNQIFRRVSNWLSSFWTDYQSHFNISLSREKGQTVDQRSVPEIFRDLHRSSDAKEQILALVVNCEKPQLEEEKQVPECNRWDSWAGEALQKLRGSKTIHLRSGRELMFVSKTDHSNPFMLFFLRCSQIMLDDARSRWVVAGCCWYFTPGRRGHGCKFASIRSWCGVRMSSRRMRRMVILCLAN